jgi:enoyl-CoA hydratase
MNTLDTSGYETIQLRRDGFVLTITLNRPAVRNATNNLMERELCRAFMAANHDSETRVVVITGAGQTFSAGGDFEYIRENLAQPSKAWSAGQWGKQIIFTMLDCIKPVVAKINGHAVGFGATLALFCDITFAANHAKIADPHVAIGLVAGDGGAVIWPQLIGYSRAKEYLFTGEPMLAPEAARIGLINHAVPAEELDRTVEAYASKLGSMPPRALQWTKASVNIGLKQLAHSIMDASMAYELLSVTTQDHREAIAAVGEKRKVDFTGN